MGNTISSDISADVEYKEDSDRFSMISWSIRDTNHSDPTKLVSLQNMCKDVANTEGYVLNEKLLREAFPPETRFIKKTIELVWTCTESFLKESPNNSLEGWLFLDDGQGENRKYFESSSIGQNFPRLLLKDQTCRIFDLGSFITIGKEIHTIYPAYIPSMLGRRIVYFYIVDDSDHLLLKVKAMVVSNDEFISNASAIPSMDERQARDKGFGSETANIVRYTLIEPSEAPEQGTRATAHEMVKELDRLYNGPRNILKLFHEPVIRAEFQAFQKVERAKIQHCVANDFTDLAYRIYLPEDGKYNHVVLYIAQNTYFTDVFAYRMSREFPICVYIAEIRGYGYSGGPRGHTKSTELVLDDVRTFVRMVRYSHHDPIHIILAGYLHTASLVLKYDGYEQKEPVSGYLFYAPNFGLNSRDTFKEDTFFSEAMKQNVVKRHTHNILLSRATHGAIKGDKPGVDMKFPDEVYILTPMTVSRITTNMMIATAATDLKAQFQSLKLPFCFLVGENDEMFIPDVLVKYAKMAKSTSKYIRIAQGLANMNIQSGTVGMVANWILNTFDQNIDLPSAGKLSGRSSITCESKNDSDISSNMENIMNNTKLLEEDLPKIRYMESYDGTMLAYQVFESKSHPVAIMLLWMEYYMASILPELADATNTMIYRFDVRGTGKSGGEHGVIRSKEQLWNDVKLAIVFARHNYPQHVIFAGGHSFGASMLLNYAYKWNEAIHPNAYIFLSPIINPFSGKNTHLLPSNTNILFSKTRKKSFWRNSSSIVWNIDSNCKMLMNEKFTKGVFCKDIMEQVLSIDIPFGIWIGSDDEFCKAEPIIDVVCALSRAPLHISECIKSQNHFGILKQISKQQSFVSWINRVSISLNPRSTTTIKDCKMNDLIKMELIGKGTFGHVWQVFHKKLEKYLALKILRKTDVVKHKLVHQVLRERNLLETTSNPFIVPFVGSFQDEHNLYILMEFLIGGELYTLLRLYNNLPINWVRFFAAELLMAISYLHEHEILYRDLKPENILLDALGHVRLIDFGLARPIEPGRSCSTFCGSPFYMAPEMVSTRNYSFPVDIWALGIVIYELLTGNPPFTGNTQVEIYRRILFGKISWPNNMDPDAKDLIQKLLEQDPNKRLGCGKNDMQKGRTMKSTLQDDDKSQGTKRSIVSLLNFGSGYGQIMRHKFFKGVDWDQIRLRQVSPPFQPAVKSDDDTGNFLKYTVRESKLNLQVVDYGDIFKDF